MKNVSIYTDGACSGNQNDENIGGWGCVLRYGPHTKELNGGEVNTTNNRMELMALIAGLSALKETGLSVDVYADSSYLVNCFRNRWYEGWQKNGWKTSAKKPVENKDLWVTLLELASKHSVSFNLIKGHLNLKGDREKLEPEYQRYVKNNGPCSFDDFLHVAEMNAKVDALANIFIDETRGSTK